MRPKNGFTLLELSIVILIIGLLAAGVFVGRDLIRASELRSIERDRESIVTAVYTFKDKYKCLPGDCGNATDYFGTDPNGCFSPVGGPVGIPGTCNGNGDERLYLDLVISYENSEAWRQLALAGLVPGSYAGSVTGIGILATPGYNCMQAFSPQFCFIWLDSNNMPDWSLLDYTGTRLALVKGGPGGPGRGCRLDSYPRRDLHDGHQVRRRQPRYRQNAGIDGWNGHGLLYRPRRSGR